jgi:DNA-binding GntR family transcriptional regulator
MDYKIPENVSEQITTHIVNKIITLKLKPGQRILESQLAEEMGVSRGPIRDSLRRLERNWLVELFPRKGARVTALNEHYIESLFDVLFELYIVFVRR